MDNLRGAFLMSLSMLFFAIEDAFIKLMAGTWPAGQIVLGLGLVGTPIFVAFARAAGQPVLTRDLHHPAIYWRNGAEMVGTFGFVMALVLIPLSLASAILQAAPLVVTMGAALFLGEAVGWRRWTAILVGLAGVLLILRPGLSGFDPASLFAVLGMAGLAARDVAVRRVPASITSLQLAVLGFASLIPTGIALMLFTGEAFGALTTPTITYFALTIAVGVVAYYLIIQATRVGDVSVVTPFRYTRLIFALIIGVLFFAERPDTLTIIGAVIVVGSGLYTLWRERRSALA